MAIQQIGITKYDRINQYQCLTTDNLNTYPTLADCAAGSGMLVVDNVNKKVVSFLYFDGTNWDAF